MCHVTIRFCPGANRVTPISAPGYSANVPLLVPRTRNQLFKLRRCGEKIYEPFIPKPASCSFFLGATKSKYHYVLDQSRSMASLQLRQISFDSLRARHEEVMRFIIKRRLAANNHQPVVITAFQDWINADATTKQSNSENSHPSLSLLPERRERESVKK